MEGKRLTAAREGAVDLTKAAATCAVLLIHCSANRFALWDIGGGPWLANAFWSLIGRWAVPAFLLCSGALMNDPDRELPLEKLLGRYVLRLVAALSVWAALYEGLRFLIGWGSASPLELAAGACRNWLTGGTFYHLYYFYFALALYLALPLTRLIIRHAGEREVRYILVLWLFAGSVLPFLQYFPPVKWMGSSLLYYLLPAAFLCPGLGLLGWYLRRHPPKGWVLWAAVFAGSFAAVFLGVWRRSAAAGWLDGVYLDAFNPFILLMAVSVFRLAQYMTRDGRDAPRWALFLSRASFCVYLVHPAFQLLARKAWFEALPPLWGVPAQAALLLVLSAVAYLVLRRVPWVNRWLI